MKNNIFLTKRVMACAISIVIALVGLISLSTLPVEQYPNIAPPMISVSTDYSGADANSIMKSVIMPLEESINGVQGMTYMQSKASSTGSVEINVYFEQGTDADMAAVNVQNRVSKALSLLPAQVVKVGVTVEKLENNTLQIAALKSVDGKFDADFIANYIDINVKPRLMRVSGVGKVINLGNTYALRIWLKPDVMAQYKLTPDDVFSAIGNQSFVAAAGSLGEMSENAYQYNMEYKGTLNTVEEFNSIVLRTADSGKALFLSDVATVEIGAVSYNFSSKIDDKPGVMFIINQAAGANATEANAEINKIYDELRKTMPAGLEFEIMKTSDDFLFAAIHNVVETLIIAILLVILVVYFFLLDFKATVIPSISICVSLLGTFMVVQLSGFSLNILTLFALVLAIGTVVDDAIVVVEAVMAKIEAGTESAFKATQEAMSEVSVAVVSCTLVFMAVFIPVTFMPGTSGTFFTQFGITIASSVGLSCVSALTLCPALCVMMFRPDKKEDGIKCINYYTKLAYNVSFNAIMGKYRKAIGTFLKRPWLSGVLLIIAFVLLVIFAKGLPEGLVPQEDQGVILCEVRCAEGSTLHETSEIMKKVEEKVKKIPEMEGYSVVNGYGFISNAGSNYGSIIIRLKNWEERPGFDHYIDMIIARFYLDCEDIKEAQVLPFQTPQIPGYGTSNNISLQLQDTEGGDVSVFNENTEKFLAKLSERPEVGSATSTFSERYPKYKIEVDAINCDRAGVSPSTVLNTLGAYCGSSYIGNYNQYGKVYRIMANAEPEYRLDPSSLNNIFVKTGSGEMAPISQFVSLTEQVGSASLTRFNLYNSIECSIDPATGYSEGDVHKVIEEVFSESMPMGYSYEYGGMSRELEQNSKSNMTMLIYLVCIILIYLILGSLYDSWFVPFAVLFSVPFGLMGSFGFSYLANKIGFPGMENNIYLQTGVIMLIGLLAKTAILITEFAAERRKAGLSIRDAAFQACEERLRPILMTVATMIFGMIPLIIEGGAGANGNRALALGVAGGMAVGTIALLFVVPAFFIVFQTLHEKIQGNTSGHIKKGATAVVAVLVATSLSSCGTFSKYESTAAVPADAYGTDKVIVEAQATPSIAELSWREFFTDPLLQQLINKALVQNTDIKSAQIAVEQAQVALKAARLAYLPSLSFSPSAQYINYDRGTSISKSYALPLSLDWQIDAFGSITSAKRQQAALTELAKYQEQAVRSNIISSVAQYYNMLQILDRQLEILLTTEKLWEASLRTQQVLMDNGKTYSTAVNQMEASYLGVKTQIIDTRKQISTVEGNLCQLLAITPQSIERNSWGAFALPQQISTGVPALLLTHRADVMAVEHSMEAAFYNTNAARAAFYPTLTLTGEAGWKNDALGTITDPAKLLLSALASLTQPIFARGNLSANLKASKLTQQDIANRYAQTVINAGNQINTAITDYSAAQEKDAIYLLQVEALQKAYDGTHILMNNGKASYLEVLTAQEALLQAQLNKAMNQYEANQAKIALYIALGGGTK